MLWLMCWGSGGCQRYCYWAVDTIAIVNNDVAAVAVLLCLQLLLLWCRCSCGCRAEVGVATAVL